MGTLFLDVTELANWQGKLTGVPRVMNELSLRYKGRQNVRFVAWEPARKGYSEISAGQLFRPENRESANTQAEPQPRGKLYGALMSTAKRSAATEKLARRVGGVWKARTSQPDDNVAAETVSIAPGDTLFILCEWHGSDPNFIDELTAWQKSGVTLVHMVVDMLPLVTPQYSGHGTENLKRYSLAIYPLCKLMFAISEQSKKDVEKWLKDNKLDPPPVAVIRLGDDFAFAGAKKPAQAFFETPKDYILTVGTIEIRKNHILLYYAYKLALQRGISLPPLVIVGRRGWKTDDFYELVTRDPEIKDKFILLENASDEELTWLYDHCLFSVYPSFYEGWGLPIAESLAHGVPCVCSGTSSMPEIAGNLLNYFSPLSTDECLAAVTDMLKPGALDMAKQKIKAYRPASWDNTYEQINNSIKDLK